jgi:hypothetical protein
MMSNDWEKDLNAYLDQIPGMPQTPERNRPRPNNMELDATELLMQKLAQQGIQQSTVPQTANSPERVEIREGTVYYTHIPAQMSEFPIAMKAGPMENTIGKDFVFKGYKDILLIEGNQSIDLSQIDKSQLRRMCIVEGMWVGTIVVPESAIVKIGQNSGSKILKG